jgi:hypothetical protein
MKNSAKKPKKGIAILLALFLLVFLVVFAEVVWSYYISNILLQRRYENTLQNLYNLEAARTACMWEANHAASGWNTITNTNTQLQGAAISGKFYRLAGFNFRAQVINNSGAIAVYAHAFRGTEANPLYSNYLEYVPTPSVTPLYQYMIFRNTDIYFPDYSYDSLLHCDGGKIHSNGTIVFHGGKIRFDQIKQLSAAGTIGYKYEAWSSKPYPTPGAIDSLDGEIDGKAPAPYVNTPSWGGKHHYTTKGEAVELGPFKNSVTDVWKHSGAGYLGETYWSPVSRLMRGEESFFLGRQYVDTTANLSFNKHLTKDGEYDYIWKIPADQRATIHRFYLSDLSGSSLTTTPITDQNGWNEEDVFFKPYQNSQEELNENLWFEIPGALPQTYAWWNKYIDSNKYANQQPVTLYATEACAKGGPGDTAKQEGWRYIKQFGGNICQDNACYNNPAAQYIKAQDYITSDGKPYYDASHFNPNPFDKNNEFFDDYTYGNDWNDPNSPYWQIRSFNPLQQPQGFQEYISMLE